MRRSLWMTALFLAAACLGGCAKTDWVSRLRSEPMYRRASGLRQSAGCARLVPVEFAQTLPVPLARREEGFAVLFYPVEASPGQARALTPLVEGRFSAAASADFCAKIPAAKPRVLGAPVPAGLSRSGYYRAQARFYVALSSAADAYWSGGEADAAGKSAAAELAEAFAAASEPPLLPYYYKLNPGFWAWLKAQSGYSIPKP
ncbi:MAG: hypothetical protein KGL04_09280 [Elusimicrobia bacterium]|nr:hypothetical protein [Elusimicrobiota bacterium]MDE2314350.1 hypothetical protein [Elusimicrobiota bacterium]